MGNKPQQQFIDVNTLLSALQNVPTSSDGAHHVFLAPADYPIPTGSHKFNVTYLGPNQAPPKPKKQGGSHPPLFVAPLDYEIPKGYTRIQIPTRQVKFQLNGNAPVSVLSQQQPARVPIQQQQTIATAIPFAPVQQQQPIATAIPFAPVRQQQPIAVPFAPVKQQQPIAIPLPAVQQPQPVTPVAPLAPVQQQSRFPVFPSSPPPIVRIPSSVPQREQSQVVFGQRTPTAPVSPPFQPPISKLSSLRPTPFEQALIELQQVQKVVNNQELEEDLPEVILPQRKEPLVLAVENQEDVLPQSKEPLVLAVENQDVIPQRKEPLVLALENPDFLNNEEQEDPEQTDEVVPNPDSQEPVQKTKQDLPEQETIQQAPEKVVQEQEVEEQNVPEQEAHDQEIPDQQVIEQETEQDTQNQDAEQEVPDLEVSEQETPQDLPEQDTDQDDDEEVVEQEAEQQVPENAEPAPVAVPNVNLEEPATEAPIILSQNTEKSQKKFVKEEPVKESLKEILKEPLKKIALKLVVSSSDDSEQSPRWPDFQSVRRQQINRQNNGPAKQSPVTSRPLPSTTSNPDNAEVSPVNFGQKIRPFKTNALVSPPTAAFISLEDDPPVLEHDETFQTLESQNTGGRGRIRFKNQGISSSSEQSPDNTIPIAATTTAAPRRQPVTNTRGRIRSTTVATTTTTEPTTTTTTTEAPVEEAFVDETEDYDDLPLEDNPDAEEEIAQKEEDLSVLEDLEEKVQTTTTTEKLPTRSDITLDLEEGEEEEEETEDVIEPINDEESIVAPVTPASVARPAEEDLLGLLNEEEQAQETDTQDKKNNDETPWSPYEAVRQMQTAEGKVISTTSAPVETTTRKIDSGRVRGKITFNALNPRPVSISAPTRPQITPIDRPRIVSNSKEEQNRVRGKINFAASRPVTNKPVASVLSVDRGTERHRVNGNLREGFSPVATEFGIRAAQRDRSSENIKITPPAVNQVSIGQTGRRIPEFRPNQGIRISRPTPEVTPVPAVTASTEDLKISGSEWNGGGGFSANDVISNEEQDVGAGEEEEEEVAVEEDDLKDPIDVQDGEDEQEEPEELLVVASTPNTISEIVTDSNTAKEEVFEDDVNDSELFNEFIPVTETTLVASTTPLPSTTFVPTTLLADSLPITTTVAPVVTKETAAPDLTTTTVAPELTTTTLAPVEITTTAAPLPTTTSPSPTTTESIAATTEQIQVEVTTPGVTSVQENDAVGDSEGQVIGLSTATEVSLMYEICFRGRCIRVHE